MVCSKFWKLDKIDKIVIALTFIVVTMFSLFSCFCYAYDTNSKIVNNLIVENVGLSDSVFSTSSRERLITFKVNKGVTYTIHSDVDLGKNPQFNASAYSLEFPAPGVEVFYSQYTSSPFNVTFSFKSNYDGYYSYVFTKSDEFDPGYLYVTQDKSVMHTSLLDLVNSVGLSQLWTVFEKLIPFALIVVVSSFGFMIIFNIIKGLSKGKGRL